MVPSFLTAVLFSVSIVCASRSSRLIGGTSANFFRLLFAILCLGVYAHSLGQGWEGRGVSYFIIGGAIGVGVGDMATFQALNHVGPRLAVLLVECLAVPLGALIERYWLGTTLTGVQMLGIAIIMAGTSLALLPSGKMNLSRRSMATGVSFGLLGALGQSVGAVLTRKGNEINAVDHLVIDGMTAAYQRMIGALAVSLLVYMVVRAFSKPLSAAVPSLADTGRLGKFKRAAPWIIANGLTGLVFGVACFQWALRGTSVAVVLAILATTPLIVIPFAYVLDNDRPSRRAIIGGVVAVAGVGVLKFS